MICLYFNVIAAITFCALIVAQKSFLAEKTSRTQNDHVVHEFANSRGVSTTSKYGDMTTVTTAALSNIGRVLIDQERLIVTVAGTGFYGYNGDSIAATCANVTYIGGIKVDGAGNIYFADFGNHLVRKVTVSTGIITTVAGTTPGYFGDNGAATSARLLSPSSVTLDGYGNMYIADFGNQRI